MQYPIVVTLSGPEKTRAKAELALEKARLTIIPPKEWPIQRESYRAEHWPHLTQLPSGQPPDDEHGFLAVLAETEAAFHAAYGVVAKAKWVLRVHHELPEKPRPDPMAELLDTLLHRLDSQEQRIAELTRKVGGHPSIGGAGFETGAGEFMQLGSYSAAQMRRSVFWGAARTSANVPGTIAGGLLSATDMQLSPAASGLVVYTSVGECLIPGTEAVSQGGYHAFLSSQNSTTLATANATNPRIDLICATSADSSYTLPTGGTSGFVTINAVTGTPTSGATLSNLLGAATLPGSSLLLGYVLVPAAVTGLTSGDIANRSLVVKTYNSSPAARASRSAALPLSGGTNKIPLDTITFDTGGLFDTSSTYRYTAPTTGAYWVAGQTEAVFGSGDSADWDAQIWRNGSVASRGSRVSVSTVYNNQTEQANVADVIQCNAGDYLELYCYVASNASASMAILTGGNYLSVVRCQ